MTAPALTASATAEVWAYAGMRQAPVAGYLVDAWHPVEPEHKPMYSRVRSDRALYIIGGLYRVKVARDGEQAFRQGQPTFTGNHVIEQTRLEWAADDAAARLAIQLKRDHDRQLYADALDKALEPLKLLLIGRRTYAAREALLVRVVRLIMQGTIADEV